MNQRSTSWSVTINNPNAADEECINLARQRSWQVEGQLEKGEGGTLHYQLLVRTPQVRFSAVKKMFPRAHIEAARNVKALEQYVTKEETREAELPSTQEQYPSLSRTWELIYDTLTTQPTWSTWRYVPGGYSSFKDEKQALEFFDWACRERIREGYVLETIAVNPQTRSAFAKFADAIFFRIYIRRHQDSQTDPLRLENYVDIPTITHNNASDSNTQDNGSGGGTSGSSRGHGLVQGSSQGNDASSASPRTDVHGDHGTDTHHG